jgi:hypothetical protein
MLRRDPNLTFFDFAFFLFVCRHFAFEFAWANVFICREAPMAPHRLPTIRAFPARGRRSHDHEADLGVSDNAL